MPHLPARRAATAVLALVALVALAGCAGTGGGTGNAGFGDPAAEHSVRPFTGREKVTAETYYAAGKFHEGSSIGVGQPGRHSPEQVRKHIKAQRRLAVKQYRKALEIDPAHQPSLFRLAALLTALEKYDDAEAAWLEYAEATGGSAGAYVNLAICREVAGDAAGAESAYRGAVAADPRHETARVNLGMLLARAGRLQEAGAELSMALEPAAVHWHLAHALADADRPEAAARHFRAAASLDPAYRRDAMADVDATLVE